MQSFFLSIAFFLLSASLFMMEIVSSRYAKIAFMHDFQFIIISFTIWGLGLGGLITYFFFQKLNGGRIKNLIFTASLGYTVLLVTPFLIIAQPLSTNSDISRVLFFGLSLGTYILAGIITSLLFSRNSGKIPFLYGLSLFGGALGALGSSLLLDLVGNSIFIYILFFVGLLSSFFFSLAYKKRVVYPFFLGTAIVVFAGFVFVPYVFFANCGQFEKNEKAKNWFNSFFQKPIQVSNSFSQLDINPKVLLPGLQGFIGRIHIDCTGVTFLAYSNQYKYYRELTQDFISFPILVKKPNSIAIIGSGAGVDVVRALLIGSEKITALEINPLIIEQVNKLDKNNVYKDPRVKLIVGEGRGNIAKSPELFDMIYIPGTKRFGDIGITPYAFVSNYLYTKEAVGTYLNKLNPNGILAIGDPSLFVERYSQAALSYFKDQKLDPANRILFVTGRDSLGIDRAVILVKKIPFTNIEINKIKELSGQKGMHFVTLSEAKIKQTQYSITDDRPFFWNFEELKETGLISGSSTQELQEKQYEKFFTLGNLFFSLGFLAGLFLSVLIAPFLFFKKLRSMASQILPYLVFFSFIGLGYIFFQLFTLEKLTFFLGSPIYSLSVVLTSFLLWGGIGSMIAQKYPDSNLGFLKRLLILFFLICVVYAVFVYHLLPLLSGLSLPGKIMTVLLILAIPTGLSGMIFPLGLKEVERVDSSLIPWMWGVDGVASVLGGILFVIISFLFGFKIIAFVILGSYFFVFISLLFLKPRK